MTLSDREHYEGGLYQVATNGGSTGEEVDLRSMAIEQYRPLEEREQILDTVDKRERAAVLEAADCRFVKGSQWHQILKDQQWKERSQTQGEYFKSQPIVPTTAREFADFYLICLECDALNIDRPTSVNQTRALYGQGNIKEKARLLASLMDEDGLPGRRTIRKKIEDSLPPRDSEEDKLQQKRAELEAREKVVANLEEQEQKLYRQEEALKQEREQIDQQTEDLRERISQLDKQYSKAIADIHQKYGERKPPSFLDVPDEVWEQYLNEAKSNRVQAVARKLGQFYSLPNWMGQYFPDEAAEAILDMRGEHGEKLTEALEYSIDWLQRTVDAVQAKR